MTVYFIGAGPGAADLLTLRGRDQIAACGLCLYAGSLIPEGVLAHVPDNVPAINTAGMALDDIVEHMRRASAEGIDVARLQSGDLSVYSALAEQLRALRAAGIDYSLTPGVPAFSAAAAALGQELTVPELGQSLVLTRTQGRASAMPDNETLENFAASRSTLAIHLSLQVIDNVVARLVPFYGADCPAAIVQRASWPQERVLRAPLSGLVEAAATLPARRSAVIFVGPVLADLRDADFRHSALYDPTHISQYRLASED